MNFLAFHLLFCSVAALLSGLYYWNIKMSLTQFFLILIAPLAVIVIIIQNYRSDQNV